MIQHRNVKQCYVLRDLHLRFGSYAVKIILTICVNLLRFALCFYDLLNVTFCGPKHVKMYVAARVHTKNLPMNVDVGY